MPMSCPPSRAELPLETISSGHHRTTPPAPIVRPCIFPFPSPLPFPASHPRIHPAEVITHAVNFAALPFSRPSIPNQEKNIQEPPPLLKPIQHLLYSSMSSLPLCPFFVGLHFTSLPLPSSSPLLCRFITSSSFSHPLISRTFTNLFYILLQQPQNSQSCERYLLIPQAVRASNHPRTSLLLSKATPIVGPTALLVVVHTTVPAGEPTICMAIPNRIGNGAPTVAPKAICRANSNGITNALSTAIANRIAGAISRANTRVNSSANARVTPRATAGAIPIVMPTATARRIASANPGGVPSGATKRGSCSGVRGGVFEEGIRSWVWNGEVLRGVLTWKPNLKMVREGLPKETGIPGRRRISKRRGTPRRKSIPKRTGIKGIRKRRGILTR